MFKRITLMLAFLAAFTTVSVGVTDTAQAWRGYWGRPYGAYYAPRAYYAPVVPYRAYYGPRVYRSYYAPSYYAYPAYPAYYGDYYYGPRSSVSFSFGY